MKEMGELLKEYTLPVVETEKDKKWKLIGELSQKTGYSRGQILARTKKMQTVEDLRFILSAMKTVRNAKDDRHRFNTVLFNPPHP